MPSAACWQRKDLDRQPLIMYAPIESRYHHDLVSSMFRAAGISPNFVQYAREIHTMLALVGAGIGVALVPAAAGTLGFAASPCSDQRSYRRYSAS